jgi:hypothetical protein
VGPPARETPGPPGRETPKPTATLTPRPTDKAIPTVSPEGTYIRLAVKPSNQIYWTEIEWQDGLGKWHKVDGWKGSTTSLTNDESIQWFMDANLFQAGPFRWLVYSEENGRLLKFSEPFCLPGAATEILMINLDLNDENNVNYPVISSCPTR